ncbi:MAG: winged helix-turn-helix domain-containing protein [Pseudomonadota bacterium]
MSGTIKIDKWAFSPDTGTIAHGDETRRLENRAAALLELLARSPGDVVSQSDILEQVWHGRTVSPNSIAVVISDLRRALDDDPKSPKILETLPKRGYRLIAEVAPAVEAQNNAPTQPSVASAPVQRWRWVAVVAFAALVLGLWSTTNSSTASVNRTSIMVSATVNETGDDQYLPLTRSVTELLAVEVTKYEQFKVSADQQVDVIVRSKLILWDGHPSMSIYAESADSGEVLWSGMASGPETLLPRQVKDEMAKFADLNKGAAVNR